MDQFHDYLYYFHGREREDVRTYEDFNYLWEKCNHNKSTPLYKIFESTSDVRKLNKDFTWHLNCAMRLADRTNPCLSQEPVDSVRRRRLISNAACIAFLAGAIESSTESSDSSPTSTKRARIANVEEKQPQLISCTSKRDRRAAIKKVMLTLDKTDACDLDILNKEQQLETLAHNKISSEALQSDSSALCIVTWAVNSLLPEVAIRPDEIEEETIKVVNFALHQTERTTKYDSTVFGTAPGRRSFMEDLSMLYRGLVYKASGEAPQNTLNEIALNLNDTARLFLVESNHGAMNAEAMSISRQLTDESRLLSKYTGREDRVLELNDWIETILEMSAHTVRPSRNLSGGCLENVIIPLLNESLGRFAKSMSKGDESQVDISVGALGELQCQGNYLFGEKKGKLCTETIARCFTALYYNALESVLHHERTRLRSASNKKLVMNVSFHRGLMNACFLCLTHAISARQDRPNNSEWADQFAFDITGCEYYDFIKVSECFVRSLTGPIGYAQTFKLPNVLVDKLQRTEQIILQSRVWTTKDAKGHPSKMIAIVDEIRRQGQWPPTILQDDDHDSKPLHQLDRTFIIPHLNETVNIQKEGAFINCCMTKILAVARRQISSICSQLRIEHQISSQIFLALRHLLRDNIDIFYDRHIDAIILCITYAVCKVLRVSPEQNFADIIKAYNFGERRCDLKNIVLDENRRGDLFQFYNTVFLQQLGDDGSLWATKLSVVNSLGVYGSNISVGMRANSEETKAVIRELVTFGSATKRTLP